MVVVNRIYSKQETVEFNELKSKSHCECQDRGQQQNVLLPADIGNVCLPYKYILKCMKDFTFLSWIKYPLCCSLYV